MGVAIGHSGFVTVECPECQGGGWASLEEICTACDGRGVIRMQVSGAPSTAALKPLIVFAQPEVLKKPVGRKLDSDEIAKLVLALRRGVSLKTICDGFGITPSQLAAYRANETRGAYDDGGYPNTKRSVKGIRKRLTPEQKRKKIADAFDALGLED